MGTKRGIAQRKERKELNRLSNRLEDRLDRDQHSEAKPGTGSEPTPRKDGESTV